MTHEPNTTKDTITDEELEAMLWNRQISNDGYAIGRLVAALRSERAARTPAPLSDREEVEPVSLEKCANIASQWYKGTNMGEPAWERISSSQREAYRQQVRAILDGAKVSYVD